MKRLITLLAMAGVLAVSGQVFGADTGKGNLKYSITVSKFENRAGWSGQWDIGDAWGAVMTDSLNASGKFIVLGEKDMLSLIHI